MGGLSDTASSARPISLTSLRMPNETVVPPRSHRTQFRCFGILSLGFGNWWLRILIRQNHYILALNFSILRLRQMREFPKIEVTKDGDMVTRKKCHHVT